MFKFDDFNPISWFSNGAAVAALFSTLLGWLPPVVAGVALVWYTINIYESKTIQNYLRRRLRNKLLSLHAQTVALEMRLVDVTDGQTMEHYKKLMGMRADVDAGLRKRELNHEHANELMRAAIEEKKLAASQINPPTSPS